MTARIKVVQGATAYHYHALPSDLTRATISPQREAMFQYLARLGSDTFVDFITDILMQVEGHTLVDRTDGPADEKQDILTLDPAGERHLTQCKHTINYQDNSTGDELDVLFSACFRKNCRRALYVTNADLTVQAKRYVTDKEYLRGSHTPERDVPSIDCWNGRRIWDRVSRSNAILNKWFSGMAQAHALRRFFLDVVITRMPAGKPCPLDSKAVARELEKTCRVAAVPENRSFDVTVDAGLMLNLSDWFRGSDELGVGFLPPIEGLRLPNVPLRAVRVQALVSDGEGVFDAAAYRDRIATVITDALPDPGDGAWWHAVATAPQAFVFLQDVAKAVLVQIERPETFVRVGATGTRAERSWAMRPGDGFSLVGRPDDPEDVTWTHDATGAALQVLVEESVHPALAYQLHLRQSQIVRELRTHAFRAVERADAVVVETIRRLTDPRWFVLQSSSGEVFWAYPPDVNGALVEQLERALRRRGIEVLTVRDEDRSEILGSVEQAPPDCAGMLVTGERASVMPIVLDRRIFWISAERELRVRPSKEQALEVLKYKAGYEARHGYDLLAGETEATFASEELDALLCDPVSFRGSRMIDVGLGGRKVSIHLRVRDGSLASAAELADSYVEELTLICDDVLRLLASHDLPGYKKST